MIAKLEPFNPKTPFLEGVQSGAVASSMQKWFAQIPPRLNAAPLITGIAPANSNSKGVEGQMELDDNFVYFFKNGKWRRVAAGLF